MKNSFLVLSEKSWHKSLFQNLKALFCEYEWHLITSKDNFDLNTINKLNPIKIFIPHWSYIIPKEIFHEYDCIVFHMTDLPFGRGGSPLQNLIERGATETKISALKVEEGIDTGPIYLKKNLSLEGTATEIFERSSAIIEKMIVEILENDLKPVRQQGKPVIFKRRKPAESNISKLDSLEKVYDYIRMLDCQGYPNAFIETEFLKFEFSEAKNNLNEISAHVRITKK